jgi:hypothetical protein
MSGYRCVTTGVSFVPSRVGDTGGAQEACDAGEANAVGGAEEGGGGVVAVGGDQVSGVALIEASRASSTEAARSGAGCARGW